MHQSSDETDAILISRTLKKILSESSESTSLFKKLIATSSLPRKIKESILMLSEQEMHEMLLLQAKINPADSKNFSPSGVMIF